MKKKIKSTTLFRTDTLPVPPGEEPKTRTYKYSYTEYNKAGNLTLEIRYNEDGEMDEKVVNRYDDQGRLVEEKSYLEEDEVAEHKQYEWNDRGQIEKAYKIYQDGEKDTIHYKRNEKGKLVEKVTIDSYNEEEAREVIEYSNDLVMHRQVIEYDEVVLEEAYAYDGQGNMTEMTKWSAEEEEARYKSRFDEKGNLLKSQKFNLKEELLSQAEYIFENDRLVRIVEEHPQGQNTTTIQYDEAGHAREQVEKNSKGKINHKVLRNTNENGDVSDSEIWIYYHGQGIDQHYSLKYEYSYFD